MIWKFWLAALAATVLLMIVAEYKTGLTGEVVNSLSTGEMQTVLQKAGRPLEVKFEEPIPNFHQLASAKIVTVSPLGHKHDQ